MRSAILLAGLLALSGLSPALAQRLDSDDCTNALYHYEDGFAHGPHFRRIWDPNARVCVYGGGAPECQTGRQVIDNWENILRSENIVRQVVVKMALTPEFVGGSNAACLTQNGRPYRLGFAVDLDLVTPSGGAYHHRNGYDLTFTTLRDGTIRITQANIFTEGEGAWRPGLDPFARRQFLFDRTYGTRRTVFARGVPNPNASTGSSGSSSAASGPSTITVTETASGSLNSNSNLADQSARSNAITAAQGACRRQGGTVTMTNASIIRSERTSDTTSRSTARATVQCRLR